MRLMTSRLLALAALLVCSSVTGGHAGEVWLSAGGGVGPRGFGAWQAVSSAPLGVIDAAGPRLRAFLSQGEGDNSATLEGGWSFGRSTLNGVVLAGVEVRAPSGRRSRSSAVVSAALETRVGGGGVLAFAMLRPAYGEAWAELRPWLRLDDCWKVGVVAAGAQASAATGLRAGVFTSGYRIVLPVVRELFVGGELGLQWDRHDAALAPYGGVNLGFGF
jgi:hypothetical protein